MKLLYLIYVQNQGMGGHYYSCLETAQKMSDGGYDVSIVSIGRTRSPVLEAYGEKYSHIDDGRITIIYKSLLNYVYEKKIMLIHCFDSSAYFWGRRAANKKNIKLVLTKCGGPNPKKYYPSANDLILYSKENLTFFKREEKYKNTNMYLIPNRVDQNKIPHSERNVLEIKAISRKNSIIFMRINRIGSVYQSTMEQAIKLVVSLNEKGVSVDLFIIGAIENQALYESLISSSPSYINFLTNSHYTIEAAKNIDAADFVIGTGRGFMEAALKNKVMLVPTANKIYPEIITKNNFSSAFAKNFSPRYRTNKEDNELFNEIINVVKSTGGENNLNIYQEAFDNFSSDLICKKLNKVYVGLESFKDNYFDLMSHSYWMARYYISRKVRGIFDFRSK